MRWGPCVIVRSAPSRQASTPKSGHPISLVGPHSAVPHAQELRPLVYPLAQVLVSAVRLLPSPRYFPLHLRLLRALVGLGAATRLLLPVTPLLLDMLRWAALHRRVRGGSGTGPGQPAQPQGVLLLRASKAALATAAFQQDILEQVGCLPCAVTRVSEREEVRASTLLNGAGAC